MPPSVLAPPHHSPSSLRRRLPKLPSRDEHRRAECPASKLAIGNQLNAPVVQRLLRFQRRQHRKLFFPLSPQTGRNPVKIRIYIARMANKFPSPLRHVVGDGLEKISIEMPRSHNSQGTVRRSEASLRDRPAEPARQSAQSLHLRVAFPQAVLCPRKICRDHLERIANRSDAARSCRLQDSLQRSREHVRVLVRVDMRHRDSIRLQLPDLLGRLGFNLLRINSSSKRSYRKSSDSVPEGVSILSFDQAMNPRGLAERHAIQQHNVTTDTPPGIGLGKLHRLVERQRVCHQRRGSYNAVSVRLQDGPVHPTGESEIVGIHNQSSQALSLAVSITRVV